MYRVEITLRKAVNGPTIWAKSDEFSMIEDCFDWAAEMTEEDILWFAEETDDAGLLYQEGESDKYWISIHEVLD